MGPKPASEFDKMTISHGNRNKRCLPTENGGLKSTRKKVVLYHFCSQVLHPNMTISHAQELSEIHFPILSTDRLIIVCR